ncbi:MAG: discoidin domain-containing protein [Fimbriiglobus sp.]
MRAWIALLVLSGMFVSAVVAIGVVAVAGWYLMTVVVDDEASNTPPAPVVAAVTPLDAIPQPENPAIGGPARIVVPAQNTVVPPRGETALGLGNTNLLVIKHKGRMTASASTASPGWPASKVIDGSVITSWFSTPGGQAGKQWVRVEFPEPVRVTRVTVLGNREPQWPVGYTVLTGTIALMDEDENPLATAERTAIGPRKDFDFRPEGPVEGVKMIEFRVKSSERSPAGTNDVAIAEILVE